MFPSVLGSAAATFAFAITLLGLALIGALWLGAQHPGGERGATSARVRIDALSILLLGLGFVDIYLALPHGHPPIDPPALVRSAALPLAYIAIAAGAAMRLAATRLA